MSLFRAITDYNTGYRVKPHIVTYIDRGPDLVGIKNGKIN
jgi:hypothetical protein